MKPEQPKTAQQFWLEYSTTPLTMLASTAKQNHFTPRSQNICDLCLNRNFPITIAPCLQCSHYKD